MPPETDAPAGPAAETETRALPAQPRPGPSALELEQSRIKSIKNLCKGNKIGDDVRDRWITSGMSIDHVSEDLLNILEERGKNNPQSETRLGLSHEEIRRFSMSKAIGACGMQNWTKAGFEAECSREISGRLNLMPEPSKFYVPLEIQRREQQMSVIDALLAGVLSKRDLTVATGSAGGFLVETTNVGFIEMLRNRTVCLAMGARQITGLQGSVMIPKQTAAATASWLSTEATAITEAQQTFAQVVLSPKNVGGYTELSRQLVLQSNPSAEGLVMSDLAAVVAIAVDLAGLNGSGAAGQPTGIINTAGIGGVTGTSLAYAGIVEFQTDTAGGNALAPSSGYVGTPAVAGLLKQRVKFTSTASPIWEGQLLDGTVDGYRAMASNQVPSANLLFGDFNQLVMGEWGVLEVEVNPFANFPAGIVGVRAMYTIDFGVRYPVAFSLATVIT